MKVVKIKNSRRENTRMKAGGCMRTTKFALLAIMFILYGNLASQNFTKVMVASLPALKYARAQWIDVNNDGLLDLFISGTSGVGTLQTAVYSNNGNGSFNTISLTALADIAVDFGDYNNDGYIDIITSGVTSGNEKKILLYKNNNGTGFLAQSFSLEGLSKGDLLWRDLDSDGDLDILMTGLDQHSNKKIVLYEFTKNSYYPRSTSLAPVNNGQLKSIDATSDGNPDVVITGLNESGLPVTLIYAVDGQLNFHLYSGTLQGSAFNSIASADLNGDQYEDIVITGLTGDALVKQTAVFQNNKLSDFTHISTPLANLSASSTDIGDLNNDGLADLILTGLDNSQPIELKRFLYYQNNAAFSFSSMTHAMKNIYSGDVALGDYDNDGDLDIFQIGNSDVGVEGNLYTSDRSAVVANAAPVAPAGLVSSTHGSSVTLSWSRPVDDHTASNSLSFNVYLSKSPNGKDLLVSPMADQTTGFRRIVVEGNNRYAITRTIQNLPEGRYYWSVQAIDNAYKGSVFASEQSFVICYPISLGIDKTICYKNNIHLEMGSATDVVNWYSKANGLIKANAKTFDRSIEKNETIIAELTNQYGCTLKDTLEVTMMPLPVVDLGADVDVCFHTEFSRKLTAKYDSANWFHPAGLVSKHAFSYSYTALKKDTIIVQVFNSFKCVNYDSVIVNVVPLPKFSVGNDQKICYREQASLSINGTWPAIEWTTLVDHGHASNRTSYLYTVLHKDTVVAHVTDVYGCVNYDSAIVDVLPLPHVNAGDDVAVCYNESKLLQVAPNGSNNNWYSTHHAALAINKNQYSHHVLKTDTLIVKATDNNACVNVDSVIVKMIPLPIVNIGADTAICFKKDILLSAGAGFQSVNWFSKSKSNKLLGGSWFYNYNVIETDTLIARVQSAAGCINYDSIKIKALVLPDFSLGSDIQVCSGDSIRLSVPGSWKKVNWYTVDNIMLERNKPKYHFKLNTDISVATEIFHLNGCVNYDTLNVTMLALPKFELGPDQTYCTEDKVFMDVGNIGTSYAWVNSANQLLSKDHSCTITASKADKIFLAVTNSNHCRYIDSVSVRVNALPVFDIEGASEICKNDKTILSVNSFWQSLVWHRLATDTAALNTNTFEPQLKSSSEISATLMDINQCVATRSFFITVHEHPLAMAGADTLLCYGASSLLGTSSVNKPGLTFEWSPSTYLDHASIAQPIVKPKRTTEYILTVINAKGCSSADTVYVEVNPEITVDAGKNAAVCIGNSITVGGEPTASGSKFGYQYEWYSDAGVSMGTADHLTITPENSSVYYVHVTSGKCEMLYDSVIVTVNALPLVGVIGKQSIGAESSVTLSATGGVRYAWSPAESLDDSTVPSPLASPVKSTTYRVVVTDEHNCAASATVDVLVQNNLFIPSLFTPNNDGHNDIFKVYGSGIEQMILSIYDQNGNLVFYADKVSEALESGWDGTRNGKILKDDIYTWTIDGKFYNGEALRYQGQANGIIKLMR